MVRIVNRSQSGNRSEWLKELERQKMELQDKKRKEKDFIRNISEITLSEPNYKEFGGRRRAFNDIVKLEHDSLPKIHNHSVQDQMVEKRSPFSGAVRLKEASFHKTRSWLDSTDGHLNLEYKLALEKQIQEKKERMDREKAAERQLELKEISNSSFMQRQESSSFIQKQESNESFNFPKMEKKLNVSHQAKKTLQSKIPKLKYFTSTTQDINNILPVISKFTDLIGRTSQMSFKREALSVKNPPPVLIKEKQVVRKPVKIVQKYPVRTTELTTPPKLGKRSWPAGARAIPLPSIKDSQLNKDNNNKSLVKKDSDNVIPFKLGTESRVKSENSDINLDESLERRKAIKELQALWTEYEHDNRVVI